MHIRHILILLILIVACGKADVSGPSPSEPASLTVTLSIPELQILTKASYADGDVSEASADSWNNWERLVDGQLLYHVTLFLVRKSDNKLVAYRNFKYDSGSGYVSDHLETTNLENGFCSLSVSGTDTTITMTPSAQFTKAVRARFDYRNPQHGDNSTSIEKIVTGTYLLYAVANYSPISGVTSDSGSKSYAGLADESNYTTAVNTLISSFTSNITSGVDFTGTEGTAVTGYKIHTVRNNSGSVSYTTGEELYICERRPQPLTFVKEINVLSGDNYVSAKLTRTYSRIRFELANESQTDVLTLKNFTFTTDFSQKEAYLFPPDDAVRFSLAKGKPDLNASGFAIHDYIGNDQTVPITSPGASTISKRVIYDAYILESRNGADTKYVYDIDVSYDGHSAGSQKLLSTTEIMTVEDFNTWYTTPRSDNNDKPVYMFLLYNGNKKAFLYDDNLANGRISATLDNNSNTFKNTIIQVDKDLTDYKKYVWQFEQGVSGYCISNLATTNYIGPLNPDTAEAPVYTTTTNIPSYELVNNNTGLVIKGETPTTLKYLMVSNSGGSGYLTHRTLNDVCRFSLYPVSGEIQARALRSVTVQIVDPSEGTPSNLTEISRNDYLRIAISVTYNPDGGYLYFIVKPWEDKRNEEVIFE